MKVDRRTILTGAVAAGSLWAVGCATGSKEGVASGPSSSPKKILILGGTNFVGPQLVSAAKARGHTLTLFNRGKTNPGMFTDIEQLHGDRDGHLEALKGRQWDVVLDTSGYVPRLVKDSAELLAPQVGHYIFVSTISVYSDLSKPNMDESGPLEKVPDEKSEDVPKYYGGLKVLCERAANAAMPGRVTVVRPGLIVGPGDPTDRYTYWPVRMARGGDVLAPGNGTDPVQYIDARDLAEWMILLAERKTLGTFNALGPEKGLPMKDFLAACQQAAGGDTKLDWVNADFLDKHNVKAWVDLPMWLPGQGETAGAGNMNCHKAVEAGLRFRPPMQTAKDTLAWFKALPVERQEKAKFSLTPDREREVLDEWHKARHARRIVTPRRAAPVEWRA